MSSRERKGGDRELRRRMEGGETHDMVDFLFVLGEDVGIQGSVVLDEHLADLASRAGGR